MLEMLISFIEWISNPFKRKKSVEKPIDHSVYMDPEFRAITWKDKFYIQKWVPSSWDDVDGGTWYNIYFNEYGNLPLNEKMGYDTKEFKTKEEACSVLKKILAGQRYFPEYDKIKFAVLDCDCEETKI